MEVIFSYGKKFTVLEEIPVEPAAYTACCLDRLLRMRKLFDPVRLEMETTSFVFEDDPERGSLSYDNHYVARYINASFPFSKFHAVLEYGGPSASSRISTAFPELDDFPLLYFVKLDVEDLADPKALCHGVDMPKPFSSRTKDDCHLISTMSNTKNNVIDLLNFMPLENLNLKLIGSVDEDGACSTMLPCVSQVTESEKLNGHKPSSLSTVIIVNTQNLDKEMIILRRSTPEDSCIREIRS